MKRVIDLISPIKRFHGNVTCLLDLPDEMLLIICRYMSTFDILHCFYTPENPNMRLHCLISDYYTKINLGAMPYNQLSYFINLFNDSNNLLRPESLILTNQYISCLIEHYFSLIPKDITKSILVNLLNLTLFDCSSGDIQIIDNHYKDLEKLESLHITMRKIDYRKENYDIFINRTLFASQMSSLHTVTLQSFDGLSLYNSLKPHQNLRYINISLQTIDDLFILLNRLIPNVQTLIVQLCQRRLLTCNHPECKPLCYRLIDFTLLDISTGIVFDDIESILGYMPDISKLTLSIRNTYDTIFCHGHKFESMLIKHLTNLRQFNYTMTHRTGDQTLIEEFIRWPMNSVFYLNENIKLIHMFSIPWPSNQQDKRKLPIVNGKYNKSITSDVELMEYMNDVNISKDDDLLEIKKRFRQIRQLETCLSINIILPQRISKLILSEETPIGSIDSIPQLSILHLIVKRRLIDEKEISILNHQFPNVKYLELLFPFKEESYLNCFKTVFNLDDTNEKRCFWSKMINFRTKYTYQQILSIWNDEKLHHWLTSYTDLKYHSTPFYANHSSSMFSIWL